MSLKAKATVRCSKCFHSQVQDIYKSVNSATDPDLKAAILDGSLFLWECPECGTQNLSAWDMLYHDPEGKIMVWLLPSGEPEGPEKDAIMRQARAMGDYKLRIVANPGDLMEKLMIFDASLDDRAVELVKYVAAREEGMNGVENLHFYRMQDDVMVFSGIREGKMQGFGFGLNVYEDCVGIIARNPEISREEGFCRVDSDWVLKILA